MVFLIYNLWSLATHLDQILKFYFYKPSGSNSALQTSEGPYLFIYFIYLFICNLPWKRHSSFCILVLQKHVKPATSRKEKSAQHHSEVMKLSMNEQNPRNPPQSRHLDSPLLQAAAGRQWSLSVHRQQQDCGKDAAGDDSVQRESHVWLFGISFFWW